MGSDGHCPDMLGFWGRGGAEFTLTGNSDEHNGEPWGCYVPSPDFVATEVDGDTVILPLAKGIGDLESELYSLTWSGRVIWDLLDGKRTLQDIVNKLFPEFDAPVEELEGDVTGFVVELLGRGMLVEVSG